MTAFTPRPSRALVALCTGLLALAALGLTWAAKPEWFRRSNWPPFAAALATAAGTTQVATERRGKPNRLIHEKSPYLLQHAYNPVDWYPWGDEAFAKARAENKPIFLSIGYSTCHWCHVMEHESFENDSVAALLNEYFVAIKVDREERPDVDRLYMTASQAMGTGGGWPLNVFLTPALEPFFGGTYFPPTTRMGRPGMMELLPRVHEAWTTQHEELVANAKRVVAAIDSLAKPDAVATAREQLLAEGAGYLERAYDAEHGGFGNAPKFPSVVNLNFLLRWWTSDPKDHAHALVMVRRQLDVMRAQGIHDQLGGGFHRYATDREWLVPHFEKMLYDQAQLAWAYLEGFQITRDPLYAATARDIFAYVSRDLSSPEGGFYSAEDADSEGEEGKFYVWTPAQIEAVLGADDAALIAARYDVTPHGNFEHGTSILHEVRSIETVAREAKLGAEETRKRLDHARAALLAARDQRVRPHRDDKVLVAWNGLMISAYARGARALDDPALAARAAKAADFIWTHLRDSKTGALTRRWRDGEAKGAGQLDDYAYYTLGLIDLYEATLEPRWLERAVAVTTVQIERFWDEDQGGFFESPAGDPHITVRMKDGFDGAEMAGNSIAAQNLQCLGVLRGDARWIDISARTLDYYSKRLTGGAAAMPQMLAAIEWAQARQRQIVIAGDPSAADTRAMLHEANRRFAPYDQLLLVDGGSRQKALAAITAFVGEHRAKDGKATAYVCVNRACKLPTNDLNAFAAQLDEPADSHHVAGER